MIWFVLVLSCTLYGQKTVLLDPGHGGVYTGAVSGKLVEKEVALDVALRVGELLKKRGYRVFFTRTTDSEFDDKDLIHDLTMRAALSRTYKADIYVSIHFNGSENRHRHGYQVYVPYITKYPIRSYSLASALHYEISHTILPEFGAGTLGNVNILDEGIRAARFNVLMKTFCPAVLVELGYLTNPEEARKISTHSYRETLASAVSKGIRRYFEKAQ